MKRIYHVVTLFAALLGLLLPSVGRAQELLFTVPAFATGSNPNSVAIADVNGDGNRDVVTANYYDNTVSVLLGRYPTTIDTVGESSRSSGIPSRTFSQPSFAGGERSCAYKLKSPIPFQKKPPVLPTLPFPRAIPT